MPISRTLLSILAVPLIALLIACGGDDDGDGSPSGGDTGGSGSTSQPAATQTGSGGGGAQPAATQTASSDDIDIEDCPELLALVGLAASGPFGSSPQSLDDVEFDAQFFQQLAANSPSEIRADMQVFATAMAGFFQAMERLNVDFTDPASFARLTPAQIAELERASAALDTPELERALERIDDFFTRECA